MPTNKDWADLKERLERAQDIIKTMANETFDEGQLEEGHRLSGKAEGLGLALSYLQDSYRHTEDAGEQVNKSTLSAYAVERLKAEDAPTYVKEKTDGS
jgi:hypothetical protein